MIEAIAPACAFHPMRHCAHRYKILGCQGLPHRYDFFLAVGRESWHERFEGGVDVHEFFTLRTWPFSLRVIHWRSSDRSSIGRFPGILDRDASGRVPNKTLRAPLDRMDDVLFLYATVNMLPIRDRHLDIHEHAVVLVRLKLLDDD